MCVALGIHSLAVWSIIIIYCAPLFLDHTSKAAQASVQDMSTLLILIVAPAIEYHLANLLHKTDEQIACNRQLLELATDGTGVLDVETGKIEAVSIELSKTFNMCIQIGQDLREWIDKSDHHKLDMLRQGSDIGKHGILLTCVIQNRAFDARLVPYEMATGGSVAFFVQVVGESRDCASSGKSSVRLHEGPAPSDVLSDDEVFDTASSLGYSASTVSAGTSYKLREHRRKPARGALRTITDMQEVASAPSSVPSSAPSTPAGRRASSCEASPSPTRQGAPARGGKGAASLPPRPPGGAPAGGVSPRKLAAELQSVQKRMKKQARSRTEDGQLPVASVGHMLHPHLEPTSMDAIKAHVCRVAARINTRQTKCCRLHMASSMIEVAAWSVRDDECSAMVADGSRTWQCAACGFMTHDQPQLRQHVCSMCGNPGTAITDTD